MNKVTISMNRRQNSLEMPGFKPADKQNILTAIGQEPHPLVL